MWGLWLRYGDGCKTRRLSAFEMVVINVIRYKIQICITIKRNALWSPKEIFQALEWNRNARKSPIDGLPAADKYGKQVRATCKQLKSLNLNFKLQNGELFILIFSFISGEYSNWTAAHCEKNKTKKYFANSISNLHIASGATNFCLFIFRAAVCCYLNDAAMRYDQFLLEKYLFCIFVWRTSCDSHRKVANGNWQVILNAWRERELALSNLQMKYLCAK